MAGCIKDYLRLQKNVVKILKSLPKFKENWTHFMTSDIESIRKHIEWSYRLEL